MAQNRPVAWPDHNFSAETKSYLLGPKCWSPIPVVQLTAVMALGKMGSLALCQPWNLHLKSE